MTTLPVTSAATQTAPRRHPDDYPIVSNRVKPGTTFAGFSPEVLALRPDQQNPVPFFIIDNEGTKFYTTMKIVKEFETFKDLIEDLAASGVNEIEVSEPTATGLAPVTTMAMWAILQFTDHHQLNPYKRPDLTYGIVHTRISEWDQKLFNQYDAREVMMIIVTADRLGASQCREAAQRYMAAIIEDKNMDVAAIEAFLRPLTSAEGSVIVTGSPTRTQPAAAS